MEMGGAWFARGLPAGLMATNPPLPGAWFARGLRIPTQAEIPRGPRGLVRVGVAGRLIMGRI